MSKERPASTNRNAAAPAGKGSGRTSTAARRRLLFRLLGQLPTCRGPVVARTVSAGELRPGIALEKLELDLNGRQRVPAWFVRPQDTRRKVPAILYNHYHAGRYNLGKDEFLTPKPEQGLTCWAESIAAAGYAGLCIDAWGFGERSGRSELDLFKEMLWHGQVLWGMMVYDSWRALDYLAARPEVDPGRLATLGMSMGSTMAWWLAALDRRVKVCVDLCCLTDFDSWSESGDLSGHGIYYFVPALRKHFTSAQINSLIAPRAHLALAGTRDPLTPSLGLERIDRELRGVYESAGRPERWRLSRYDVGHVETTGMRREALEFLAAQL